MVFMFGRLGGDGAGGGCGGIYIAVTEWVIGFKVWFLEFRFEGLKVCMSVDLGMQGLSV